MSRPQESDEEEQDNLELYYSKNKLPTYKVILLGEAGSGKTSLFLRYKHGSFRKGATLNGADRYLKEFTTEDGEKVQMVLWDTAGMERMGSLTFHYYHGAHAVLLVYALNDRTTFDSLNSWSQDTKRYAPPGIKHFLVATKCDIPKEDVEVSKEQISLFCRNKSIVESYSTSAKTGEGIEEMFQRMIGKLRHSFTGSSHHEDIWAVTYPKSPKKLKCNC